MGSPTSSIRLCDVPLDLDRKAYRADVADFVGEFAEMTSAQLNLGAAFESMFDIIRNHHLTVPARVNMLLLVVVQIEGTARQLDPAVQRGQRAQAATAPTWCGGVLPPGDFSARGCVRSRIGAACSTRCPGEVLGLLERTQRGDLQIHVQQHGLQGPLHRLTLGILVSAALLGSAMLWAMSAPPVLFGISIFGVLGVALGLALALYLLYLIWRAE